MAGCVLLHRRSSERERETWHSACGHPAVSDRPICAVQNLSQDFGWSLKVKGQLGQLSASILFTFSPPWPYLALENLQGESATSSAIWRCFQSFPRPLPVTMYSVQSMSSCRMSLPPGQSQMNTWHKCLMTFHPVERPFVCFPNVYKGFHNGKPFSLPIDSSNIDWTSVTWVRMQEQQQSENMRLNLTWRTFAKCSKPKPLLRVTMKIF